MTKPSFSLIQQRRPWDCFICCVAMALGLSYEEVEDKLGRDFMARAEKQYGVLDEDMEEAFKALGLVGQDWRAFTMRPRFATVGFVKSFLWGRRAIIEVRSNNLTDCTHLVYWNGSELFDPSTKALYAWRDVEPITLWLFYEAKK